MVLMLPLVYADLPAGARSTFEAIDLGI